MPQSGPPVSCHFHFIPDGGVFRFGGILRAPRGLPMRPREKPRKTLILWWWAEQGSNLRPRPCKTALPDFTPNHTE